MTIYLDNDYKCHVFDDGTMRPYETDYFNGKCQTYIECFRLVPAGEIWIREDGEIFGPHGTMVSPCKMGFLEAQQGYEESIAEATAAYEEGVNAAYEQ